MEAFPPRPFPISILSRSTSTSRAAPRMRGNRSARSISRICPSRDRFRVSIAATGTSTSTTGMTSFPDASRAIRTGNG